MTEVLLPRSQVAVASAVARSHATTPAGFIVVKVTADGALAHARAAARRLRTLVGLPELLVKAIADLRPAFPLFFAGTADDFGGAAHSAANVAVTVDVGTGLYSPVVHAADQLGLRDIGRVMLEYRSAALRGKFRPAQLADGTILLSLSTDGPLYTKPIVFPGHVCAVSAGSFVPDLHRDHPTGRIEERTITHLGLAYDRRVLGTPPAVRFLSALKSTLESLGGEDDSFR